MEPLGPPLIPSAPPPPHTEGQLAFQRVAGRTTPTRLLARYPLRFLVPSRAVDSRVDCCWLYTMNYGGGLVAGDHVSIDCDVGPGCTVAMTTQGSTKIYKAPPPGFDRQPSPQQNEQQQSQQAHHHPQPPGRTVQVFKARVAAGATLALLPDPYTCFRDADYRQLQEVEVAPGGNLVLVDWFTSGRMGRGESWAFDRLAAETRVALGRQLLLWEPLVLDNTGGGGGDGPVSERMAGFGCFCLVVLVGPRTEAAIQAINSTQGRPTFQQRVAAAVGAKAASSSSSSFSSGAHLQKQQQHQQQQQQASSDRCITSLCRLLDATNKHSTPTATGNALALKVAGRATEDVAALLASLLAPLEAVVGTKPYARR